jgi:hypothetical protein
MVDKSDGDKEEPTLELPGLFGRRRSRVRPESVSGSTTERAATAPTSTRATSAVVDSSAADDNGSTTPTEEPGVRKAHRAAPLLPPRLAAPVTGLLVGAVGTFLTYGALRGCEAVTSTGSCGGGPGLLLLVAILAVMVLLGGALLKLCSIADPQSTSFLAVGITAVVLMLTLLEAIFSPWMFLAVPVLSMAAYWVAHWVTTRFDDTDQNASASHQR